MKLIHKDYCQFTGITEETWYDEMAKTITLRRYQDVEHTLAVNRAMYNEHTSKKPVFNDVEGGAYHVARIPFMVIEKWIREEGFNWYTASPKERAAKLNDIEYRHLRVRPGRV